MIFDGVRKTPVEVLDSILFEVASWSWPPRNSTVFH